MPNGWLAAQPPRLSPGDRIDLIGARPGERGNVATIAIDARVVELDGEATVLEVGPDDAAAIAAARVNGYLIVVLLRATR